MLNSAPDCFTDCSECWFSGKRQYVLRFASFTLKTHLSAKDRFHLSLRAALGEDVEVGRIPAFIVVSNSPIRYMQIKWRILKKRLEFMAVLLDKIVFDTCHNHHHISVQSFETGDAIQEISWFTNRAAADIAEFVPFVLTADLGASFRVGHGDC